MKKLKLGVLFLCMTLFLYAVIEIIITLTINKPFNSISHHMTTAIILLITSSILINIWLFLKSKEEPEKQQNPASYLKIVK